MIHLIFMMVMTFGISALLFYNIFGGMNLHFIIFTIIISITIILIIIRISVFGGTKQ